MTERPSLFDYPALQLRRKRAKASIEMVVRDIAISGLIERMSDVARDFTSTAVVGDWTGHLSDAVSPTIKSEDSEKLNLTQNDADLVLNLLSLHSANDPVGQLIQMQRAMKPDGVMIAVAFGGQTLSELRSVLAAAETQIRGGLSPRVAPMGEIRDYGGLLQRAGFTLPVADSETYTLKYDSLLDLMHDLRNMGETNVLKGRDHHFTRSSVFRTANDIYKREFADEDGRLCATFELIFLTGWAPHTSQPKPLRPGSASHNLSDVLTSIKQSQPDT